MLAEFPKENSLFNISSHLSVYPRSKGLKCVCTEDSAEI